MLRGADGNCCLPGRDLIRGRAVASFGLEGRTDGPTVPKFAVRSLPLLVANVELVVCTVPKMEAGTLKGAAGKETYVC